MIQWKTDGLFIQYVDFVTKRADVSFILLLMFWRTPYLQTVRHCTKLFWENWVFWVMSLNCPVLLQMELGLRRVNWMACVHDSDMNFRHSFLFTAFDIDWQQHVLSFVIKQHISWRYLNTWGNCWSFLRTLLIELQF